jgi:hypothetical protein
MSFQIGDHVKIVNIPPDFTGDGYSFLNKIGRIVSRNILVDYWGVQVIDSSRQKHTCSVFLESELEHFPAREEENV